MAARFLALGDSYTCGVGVAEAERWPDRLASLLRAAGHALAAPVVLAGNGWSTAELHAAVAAASLEGPFGLVAVMVGANDHYRGGAPEDYERDLFPLLEAAVNLAGGEAARVLVVSIPDWTATPFAQGRDREALVARLAVFNAVNRAAARRIGALYLDVTPASRRFHHNPRLLLADGLHPSAAGHAAWARLALRRLMAAGAALPPAT